MTCPAPGRQGRYGAFVNKEPPMNPRPSSQSDDCDSRRFAPAFVTSCARIAQGAQTVFTGGDRSSAG